MLNQEFNNFFPGINYLVGDLLNHDFVLFCYVFEESIMNEYEQISHYSVVGDRDGRHKYNLNIYIHIDTRTLRKLSVVIT